MINQLKSKYIRFLIKEHRLQKKFTFGDITEALEPSYEGEDLSAYTPIFPQSTVQHLRNSIQIKLEGEQKSPVVSKSPEQHKLIISPTPE